MTHFSPRPLRVLQVTCVRSWLTHAIALRLGICSNIQFSYPARFLKETFSLESKMGTWETGPLTWAIHAIQQDGGVDDLMRARAIADVFDRYILYRPHGETMV